jgi:hypothetical protein
MDRLRSKETSQWLNAGGAYGFAHRRAPKGAKHIVLDSDRHEMTVPATRRSPYSHCPPNLHTGGVLTATGHVWLVMGERVLPDQSAIGRLVAPPVSMCMIPPGEGRSSIRTSRCKFPGPRNIVDRVRTDHGGVIALLRLVVFVSRSHG